MPGMLVPTPSYDVNAFTLASQWLNALGWPNTPSNRQALAAWFMSESPHTGTTIHVIGNNPLNITTNSGNYRLVGTHRIAVYDTPQAGINAFNSLIHVNAYNYPGIVAGFGTGNGQNAINSIINSGWVTGGTGPSYWHYVSGVRRNLLQDAFNGLTGLDTSPTELLSGFGNLVTYPVGHVFTPAEGADLIKKLEAAGYFGTGPAALIAENIFGSELAQLIQSGTPWSKQFQQALQGNVQNDASNNPITGVANAITGAVGTFLSSLLFIAAMAAGGGMALYGIYLMTKEATSPAATTQTQEVPVFVKEA